MPAAHRRPATSGTTSLVIALALLGLVGCVGDALGPRGVQAGQAAAASASEVPALAATPLVTATAPGAPTAADEAAQAHPDVLSADLVRDGDGTFTASVTLSSPYDTAVRYADAWRILSPDREELAVRLLTHPHADEQPFTRSRSGIRIPDHIAEVVVQGRDVVNGWGGGEITVAVPRG